MSIRSGTTGVANGTTHEQATCDIEEWEAAFLGLLAEPSDDGVDVRLAPVAAPGVQLRRASFARAVGCRPYADRR